MISVTIVVVALALPFCSIAEESCPEKFLRFSKDHSFCKPTNASCKYVIKSFPTKEEQIEIVNLHNMYRNKVALGDEKLGGGLDSASNMLAVSWDDELAEIAQKWAEQCLFEHDCGECRASSSFSVGQILV
uniref:U25-Theriditoxin-Lha1c_1 n=1 Tax=Latrodectus hasselti TaxID=256736 RepID=A0A482ZAG4_LATHA